MSFAAGDVAEIDDDLAKKLKKAGVVGDPKPADAAPADAGGTVNPAPAPAPAPAAPVAPVNPAPVNPAPLVQKGKK